MKSASRLVLMCLGLHVAAAEAEEPNRAEVYGMPVDICGPSCDRAGVTEAASQVCIANNRGTVAIDWAFQVKHFDNGVQHYNGSSWQPTSSSAQFTTVTCQ
jgi:hypothetical protein